MYTCIYYYLMTCFISPTNIVLLFVYTICIAYSRKSYIILQMSRLIFPAIVRHHEYLFSAVCCRLDNSFTYIRVVFTVVIYCILTRFILLLCIVWAYLQLSFIIILYAHNKSTTVTCGYT
jgi:hypothetical protein